MDMVECATLHNGQRIPLVALGTSRPGSCKDDLPCMRCVAHLVYHRSNGKQKISSDNLELTIKRALDMGYRHIDTAFFYGNERAIGKALQEYVNSTNLRRNEVYITTKLYPAYMRGHAVGPVLDESLRRLRLDYVDLYLIHTPCGIKELDTYPETPPPKLESVSVDLRETWKVMEEAVYNGKARSIGVSNFNSKQLNYICETARIQPVINQVEAHARLPQKKLQEFCKSRNILLEAFCPLGSPNFAGSAELNHVQSSDNLVENLLIMDIAQKYGRTPGQILLRNLLQRGMIVIPKSENPKRMRENIEIFSFTLSDEDMKKIDELENGERRFVVNWWKDHPDYPFHEEF